MYMFVFWICYRHMSAGVCRRQKKARFPGARITGGGEAHNKGVGN